MNSNDTKTLFDVTTKLETVIEKVDDLRFLSEQLLNNDDEIEATLRRMASVYADLSLDVFDYITGQLKESNNEIQRVMKTK